jgi:hypothetical protein
MGITWLMIGLMVMGPLPKSKLPFVVEMLMVLFIAAGWPFILYMAGRK